MKASTVSRSSVSSLDDIAGGDNGQSASADLKDQLTATKMHLMLDELQATHEALCARIDPAGGLQSQTQKKVGALLLCAGHTLELFARTCEELEQCERLTIESGHSNKPHDGHQATLAFNEAVVAKTTSACAPILKAIIDELHQAATESLAMNPWEITATKVEKNKLQLISQDLVACNLQLEQNKFAGGQESLAEGLRTIDAQVYEATTRRILDRMSTHGEEIVSLASFSQDARQILRLAVRRGALSRQLLVAFLALSKEDWIKAFALALEPVLNQLSTLQKASAHTAATLKAWYR